MQEDNIQITLRSLTTGLLIMEIIIITVPPSTVEPTIQIQAINLGWTQLRHQCLNPRKDRMA